jgi:ABC-type branched-subunit amino acid transport system ATPase component/predicted MFS family arabinose efflux permease
MPERVPRSPGAYFRWLSGQVGPTGLGPVMVLLAAASIERFGNQTLSVLLPDIRDTFHLTNQQAITTITVVSVLPALLSPFAGFLSDRVDRIRLSQWGTAAVGIVAVGLGLAPKYWLFLVLALLAGIGLLVNFPAHSSLITDYHPPDALGITFTLYLFAVSAAALLGSPLAGGVAVGLGWRGAFLLLGVPSVFGVWLLGRLRDPGRGASLGMLLESEERSSFWEGFRRVKAVRSLRRTWWAAAFFGGGVIAFTNLQSVFFKDVYHYNSLARGVVIALYGLGGLLGTVLGGWVVQTRMRRGHPELLPVINGLMVIEFGVGVVLMGLLPWSIGSAAVLFLLGIGAAGFNPAYNVMIGLVTTPRLRGQAFSYSLIWVTLGALVVAPTIGGIANHHQRAAAYVLGILIVGAGLVELTARQFVVRDVAEARKLQAAADVDALLSVRGLEVAYAGNLQILFGVDLDVRQGEVVALLGTNGAGKSTFLRAVSGLIDPVGGAVYFAGRDVTHADSVNKALLGMALVPGDRGVFPGLTVAENLQIAGWMLRGDPAQLREAVERVLGYFPVLRERWDVPAGNLSGGEQQMVVLAQALMGRPKLLMIDELSLGLAPIIVEQLLGTVRQLARDGTTILLVEQSVNVALTVAERAVFMEKGEIRFSGRTEELLQRPDVLRAVFLEGASEAMAGSRSQARARPRSGRPAGPDGAGSRPALEVRGVTKRFGGVVANEDVSLTLYEGQILGLLGPNGAGKTTLFDLISGFFPLDEGRILLHGFDISHLPPDSRARLGLGRSFQDSKLFPAMTVADTIKVALERHVEVRDPLAAALSLPAVLDSETAVDERAAELIEMLGLVAFRNKFVAEISTGTRRLIDLACILAHEPSVILFDEPSSGIAQRESEALGPMLRKVRELTGSSLLVIEHDMPLLTGLADEVVALDLGRVLAQGPPAEIVNDPRVVAAYLGTGAEAVARSGGLPARRKAAAGTRTTRAAARTSSGAGRRRASAAAADQETDRDPESGRSEMGETQ